MKNENIIVLQIKTTSCILFPNVFFFKIKHFIFKFPAYHFVLKNYGFIETTFLSRGTFDVRGESGPTGWVWLCATFCSTCWCARTASPSLVCALQLPFWKSKQHLLRVQIFLTKKKVVMLIKTPLCQHYLSAVPYFVSFHFGYLVLLIAFLIQREYCTTRHLSLALLPQN